MTRTVGGGKQVARSIIGVDYLGTVIDLYRLPKGVFDGGLLMAFRVSERMGEAGVGMGIGLRAVVCTCLCDGCDPAVCIVSSLDRTRLLVLVVRKLLFCKYLLV